MSLFHGCHSKLQVCESCERYNTRGPAAVRFRSLKYHKFSDRVVAFYNGEIIADGKPKEVFKQKNVQKYIVGSS